MANMDKDTTRERSAAFVWTPNLRCGTRYSQLIVISSCCFLGWFNNHTLTLRYVTMINNANIFQNMSATLNTITGQQKKPTKKTTT
jgi:hypothetical protein